jgi:CheY-like chemotaxis protein
LTADIQKTTRERCESLGAAAFIQKPIDADVLRSTLSGVLIEGR